ncbi:unnamed protein product [Protopolystoma xenopodis]|uniref:Uncharacterized protein n=1 Tax=Protopolystoma xenopodis TaxID=117903 RepID=A0A3S5FDS9_9PLAT|nr:unnamed protein product [Protopolystoma xenopodis]
MFVPRQDSLLPIGSDSASVDSPELAPSFPREISFVLPAESVSPQSTTDAMTVCSTGLDAVSQHLTGPNRGLGFDAFRSTVKLVATGFISTGQLKEGVELLCMIGLHADACRYLEANEQWAFAVELAKVRGQY